jgi:hypothetical protein
LLAQKSTVSVEIGIHTQSSKKEEESKESGTFEEAKNFLRMRDPVVLGALRFFPFCTSSVVSGDAVGDPEIPTSSSNKEEEGSFEEGKNFLRKRAPGVLGAL